MIIEPCSVSTVRRLCEQYHGYGSSGDLAVYAWAVMENRRPVAVYSWQPPPPGAAKSVCEEAPFGVLALSRMVAVPKPERVLKHVSKPLKKQMKQLIDRTRWPVLVTYSDEGQGHTGYVYQCSGWERTTRKRVAVFNGADGTRASRYSNGKINIQDLNRGGWTWIQRWEHWICERGRAAEWMLDHGWVRKPTNRVYKSGNQKFAWKKEASLF